MKRLSKIKLQNAVVLESQEMKMISGGSGSAQWCYIDGEGVGPFTYCTDAYCQKLYGSGAYCK